MDLVSGTNMHAHLADAFADRFAISEVAVPGGGQPIRNGGFAFGIPQLFQPG